MLELFLTLLLLIYFFQFFVNDAHLRVLSILSLRKCGLTDLKGAGVEGDGGGDVLAPRGQEKQEDQQHHERVHCCAHITYHPHNGEVHGRVLSLTPPLCTPCIQCTMYTSIVRNQDDDQRVRRRILR